VKVELSEEAEAQAAQIEAWWRENRRAAADLFTNELNQALLALEDMPGLGTRYEPRPKVRRLLLKRTHYYLYVREETERVCVVAIWSVFRGRGPRL
jgi:plasmid stabilization system protein ParE